MVPGVDTRLKSVAKAIEQVILPALPETEKLAREQAEIAIGHLRVLSAQWQYFLPMARHELALTVRLVEQILPFAADEARLSFSRALDEARTLPEDNLEAIREAFIQLGERVEHWLEATPGLLSVSGIKALIQQHARDQSRLERVWFASSGIADTSGLPSIDQFLAEAHAPSA